MAADRTTLIAAAVGGLTVLALGAASLNTKGDRPNRFSYSFPVFQETSTDHGLDQARREMSLIYRSLIKFAQRTKRLPAGDPLAHRSEFRGELKLSDDDVRIPVEWGMNVSYALRYQDARCDGTPKPTFPPRGVRDVWISCETGTSVVLLWSDGKIEVRPAGDRLVVRPRSNVIYSGWFGSVLVYADEPGVPLIYRTLAERQKSRASQPPPQFRVFPPGMGPMRFGPMGPIGPAYPAPMAVR